MNKQAMKHIDIMVLGLGYVGLPLALSLSKYFKFQDLILTLKG